MSDENDLVLVFEGLAGEANYIETILKDSEVFTFVKNEMMGQMFPHYATHGGINPIKILVKKGDFEKANEIIQNYIGK
jgi:hypothetical protein